MPTHIHSETVTWEFPVSLTLSLLFAAWLYVRGWLYLRFSSANIIPTWRAVSCVLGLVLVWIALGSPFAAYDHNLLTAHMIKHLLLMTFAPALILLGEPLRAVFYETAQFLQSPDARESSHPLVRWLAGILTRPVLCWTLSALTLVVWHIPALFTLGVRSATWHTIEQGMFFGAGILFWWPVIEPWPSTSTGPRWSMLLYLFLATLPCDILSGFLVFSDRVVYPVYFSAPRLFGFSVLEDQQCAAALMWTCVTLVYLVPAAIVCSRLLAPRSSHELDLRDSQVSVTVPQSAPRRLEVV